MDEAWASTEQLATVACLGEYEQSSVRAGLSCHSHAPNLKSGWWLPIKLPFQCLSWRDHAAWPWACSPQCKGFPHPHVVPSFLKPEGLNHTRLTHTVWRSSRARQGARGFLPSFPGGCGRRGRWWAQARPGHQVSSKPNLGDSASEFKKCQKKKICSN